MGALNLHLEDANRDMFIHKTNLSENEAEPHYTLFTPLTLFNTVYPSNCFDYLSTCRANKNIIYNVKTTIFVIGRNEHVQIS